MHIKY